jgi:hypothetical protein
MTKFEDQLFVDLMREHGSTLEAIEPPAATRRYMASRRVLLATGAGGLAVAATASALVVASGGGTPAYALTTNHDGTVTLAVYQESGITQANAKLRQLGDNVVVVPVGAGCPSITSLRAPAVQPSNPISVQASGSVGGAITVNAHGVPAGDVIVVAAETSAQGSQTQSVLTSPPTPSCVSLPATTTGGGPGPGSRSGVVFRPGQSGTGHASHEGSSVHAAHGGAGPSLSAGI